MVEKADQLLSKKEYAAAIAEYDRMLALDPGDLGLLRKRSAARRLAGDYGGAIADQRAALRASSREQDRYEAEARIEAMEYETAFARAPGRAPATAPTPLFLAAKKGDLQEVRRLLDRGEGIEAGEPSRGSNRSPLDVASAQGHLEVARLLIERGAQVDSRHDVNLFGAPRFWTPLMQAASNGHLEMIALLLSGGADLRIMDSMGWNAVFCAIRTLDAPESVRHGLEVARYLVARGAVVTGSARERMEEAEAELAEHDRVERNKREKPGRNAGVKYYFLDTSKGPDKWVFYVDSCPEGSPPTHLFDGSASLSERFPRDAKVSLATLHAFSPEGFRAEVRAGRVLTDFIYAANLPWVVSGKVRRVLGREGVENAEFLPFTFLDIFGAPLSEDYSFLNLQGGQHIIDMDRSAYRRSHLVPSEVARLRELVVDRSNIDENAKLFRAATMRHAAFLREDLLDAFRKEGITGFEAIDADGLRLTGGLG